MKLRSALMVFVASVPLALGGLNITPAEAAVFMGLGDLDGGSFSSEAFGISADGQFVVGHSNSSSGREAFRWSMSEGMVGLGGLGGAGSPPGFNSTARAVSADGSVVVGRVLQTAKGFQAFRWTEASGMELLGASPGLTTREATGVSGDGSVVVGGNMYCCLGTLAQAWSWTEEGGFVGLGDLPGGSFRSNGWGVSADGSVVVGDSTSDLNLSGGLGEAFQWTEDSDMVGLGLLPEAIWSTSAAKAISGDGSVITGSSGSPLAAGIEPFRWTEENGMVGLGLLPGALRGYGGAVSGDGTVIVGTNDFDDLDPEIREAFIWKDSLGLRNLKELLVSDLGLDLTGWVLNSATGISADGLTIVGNGINPSGLREAWIANIASDCDGPSLAGSYSGVVEGKRNSVPYSAFLFLTVLRNGTLDVLSIFGEPGVPWQQEAGAGTWTPFFTTDGFCIIMATVPGGTSFLASFTESGDAIQLSTPNDPHVQAAGGLRRSGS